MSPTAVKISMARFKEKKEDGSGRVMVVGVVLYHVRYSSKAQAT